MMISFMKGGKVASDLQRSQGCKLKIELAHTRSPVVESTTAVFVC